MSSQAASPLQPLLPLGCFLDDPTSRPGSDGCSHLHDPRSPGCQKPRHQQHVKDPLQQLAGMLVVSPRNLQVRGRRGPAAYPWTPTSSSAWYWLPIGLHSVLLAAELLVGHLQIIHQRKITGKRLGGKDAAGPDSHSHCLIRSSGLYCLNSSTAQGSA